MGLDYDIELISHFCKHYSKYNIYSFHFILNKLKDFEIKDYFYTKLFGVTLTPLIYLFVMYDYLILQIQLGNQDFWIQQVELEFFIDFFFINKNINIIIPFNYIPDSFKFLLFSKKFYQ